MLLNVIDNLFDWFLIRLATPGCWNDAEITTMNAAACRLENVIGQVAMRREQFAASERAVRQIETGRLIVALLKLAIGKIAQQLWPGIFSVTGHDCIRVPRCV